MHAWSAASDQGKQACTDWPMQSKSACMAGALHVTKASMHAQSVACDQRKHACTDRCMPSKQACMHEALHEIKANMQARSAPCDSKHARKTYGVHSEWRLHVLPYIYLCPFTVLSIDSGAGLLALNSRRLYKCRRAPFIRMSADKCSYGQVHGCVWTRGCAGMGKGVGAGPCGHGKGVPGAAVHSHKDDLPAVGVIHAHDALAECEVAAWDVG
eukprot:355620-Chlamydomonas_euryale.AAC.1